MTRLKQVAMALRRVVTVEWKRQSDSLRVTLANGDVWWITFTREEQQERGDK